MKKRLMAVFAVAAFLLCFNPFLVADHGHGKGNPHANREGDDDDRGWERRDGYEYRVYGGRDTRPPGWSHGKKTGWGNCGMPPGQAKKFGCRTYQYEGRPHYYYQDEHGRIIIRRPVVEVHGGVVVR